MKLLTIVAAVALALALTGGASPRAAQDAPPPTVGVPIGGVIMWWGLEKDIPEGFEVCDGRVSRSRDAVLEGKKPDLRDRFPMGTPDEFKFRPWELNQGGAESYEFETKPTAIDAPPPHDHGMGRHDHSMKHTHPVAPHAHSLSPSKHDHGVGSHAHAIGDHTHALGGEYTTITYVKGGKGDPSAEFLVDTGKSDATGDNDGASSTQGKSLATDDAALSIGAQKLTTGNASQQDTGPPKPDDTHRAGTKQTHAHDLVIEDVRPPHTRFIFIIRVR